ncbi:hypothetical protein HDU79_002769 [Rhizoclosmatium sp. JEL0117]|nr:hypothetical protein HDU79_002769 [Rhizoclosmatium sp. JEL0117]
MCYMAAEGSNALANLTDSRLVHEIDRVAYFSSFLPAIVPPTLPVSIPTPDSINDSNERKRYRHLRKDGSKRKYDLAYLIMAHGNMSRIQSIETLVDELDDGSAIFLIHVDKRKESLPLMKAVTDLIVKREQAMNDFIKSQKLSIDAWDDTDVAGNVFMAATPFEVSWGHGNESFLGTVIKNLPQFNQKLASSKRYFKWQRNSPHPEILGPNATFGIDKEDSDPKYLFVRKVDASTSQGMDLIGRIRTEYIFKHLRNDKEYPQMEGTLFTPPK